MPTMNLPESNPTQYLDSYSKILGIKQAQQTLQTGKALQQTAQAQALTSQADAWKAQQSQREMQFMAMKAPDLLNKDPNSFDADGVLKADYVASQLAPGMPTTWPEVSKHIYDTQASGIAVKQAALGFNTAERTAVASALSGPTLSQDFQLSTPSDLADYITTVKKQLPTTAGPMVDAVIAGAQIPKVGADGQPIKQYTPEQASGIKQHIQTLTRPLLSPSEQSGTGGLATGTPSEQDTGGNIVAGVRKSAAQGGGFVGSTTTTKGLPPGAQVVEDANGRKFVVNFQTNRLTPMGEGGGVGGGHVQGGPPAVGGGRPSVKGSGISFTQPVPNQGQIQQDISLTRKADADYGTNRHINDSLLRLSADTNTGPGTKNWKEVLASIGAPIGTNSMSDYQTIGAFLDRQAAMSTKQMGLPETNAGLSTAAGLSGTTAYQPKALQTKVRLTDALVEGAHQYRLGLDKIVGTGTNQDLTKYQEFQSAWASNFEPNVFRAENDLRRGDKQDIQELKKEVGANGWKELQRKSKILGALTNGELPK